MSARPESDLAVDPPGEADEGATAVREGDEEGAGRGGGNAGAASRLDAETLVALVAEIAGELRSGEASSRVELDTDLYQDLGLDSLARMELLARLERTAGASLPDRVLAEATTPRELLRAFESVRSGARARDPGAGPAAARTAPGAEPISAAGPAAEAGPEAVPTHAETLIDALAWHAGKHPERDHVRLVDETESESVLTYGALLEGARRVAAGLVRSRLTPGRAVAIMLPTGVDYLRCFLGVQLAGGVPLPIYPPARLAQLEDHLRRHERILDNADAEWLVTFDEARRVSRLLAARSDGGCRVATVRELEEAGGRRTRTRAASSRPGRHRLPPVHLGQHRPAEGGRAHPPQRAREPRARWPRRSR